MRHAGNSKDRRRSARSNRLPATIDLHGIAAEADPLESSGEVPFRERFAKLFDNGVLQSFLGIIGGLAGTFLDGRYFVVLSLLPSYAIHRSRALAGLGRTNKILIHTLAVALIGVALWTMGVSLNRSRPHTYTPDDYVRAMSERKPLPITQTVNNYFESHFPTQRGTGQPLLHIGEFSLEEATPFFWDFVAPVENYGDSIAYSSLGSVGGQVGTDSPETEKRLFDRLEAVTFDRLQPRLDIAPGPDNRVKLPIRVPLTAVEQSSLLSGSTVLFIGAIQTYRDAERRWHRVETCMFYQRSSAALHYCTNHNDVAEIAAPRGF